MAKDRRNKTRQTVNLEADSKTSASRSSSTRRTTSSTRTKAPAGKRRKKTKLSRAALIIRCVLALLIIAMMIFLGSVAVMIFNTVMNTGMPKQEMIDPTLHDTTPTDLSEKVAYYLVGVLGEEDTADSYMMSVVCYDKVNKTVNILELPGNTYVATENGWKANTVEELFGNPKPLDWCNTCGCRVYASDIVEGGEVATHSVCGSGITTRKGSGTVTLIDFVNDQLALPVDDYFLLRPDTIAELVDCLGGIDLELDATYTLAETEYTAGIHTLGGAAVKDYFVAGSSNADRRREVMASLINKIFRVGKENGYETVEDDVISEVMSGKYPILTGISGDDTDDKSKNITALLQALSDVGVGGMIVQNLPGESAKDSDDHTVFSAHREELLTLLNNSFTPHGPKLSVGDLLIPELANNVAGVVTTTTLADALPKTEPTPAT